MSFAQPRFDLGRCSITRNALTHLAFDDILSAIFRHVTGDWGELCAEDRAENDRALLASDRLLSAYRTKTGVKFWIITEWDRSYTTILLPEDY